MTTLTSSAGGPLAAAAGRNPISLLEPPASPSPAQHGKEPPGSAGTRPFAAVLDDNQARTATAEGHHHRQESLQDAASGGDPHAPDTAGADDRGADDATPAKPAAPDAAALAALLGGVPLPAGVTVTSVPATPAAQSAAQSAATPAPATPSPAAGLPATTPAGLPVAPMPTGPAVPAAASTLPLRPTRSDLPPSAVASAAAVPVAEPADAVASATRLAGVLRSAAARPTAASAATAPIPAAATVAGATAATTERASAAGGASAGAAQAATPTTPLAQAAALTPQAAAPASTPAETAAPGRGVGLEHAVETVQLALRAGAERGISHARISLTPRELGTIEVHLRQTADGLVARVVAEHATAAQQLQQAGTDLRRQLEQSGITVLQLDIGASGEQGGRAAGRDAFAGGAFGDGDDRGARGDDTADPLAALDGAADTTPTTTLALPNGALVDVLA